MAPSTIAFNKQCEFAGLPVQIYPNITSTRAGAGGLTGPSPISTSPSRCRAARFS